MAHFIPSAGVHRKGSSNSTTTAFCAPLKKKRRWAPGRLVAEPHGSRCRGCAGDCGDPLEVRKEQCRHLPSRVVRFKLSRLHCPCIFSEMVYMYLSNYLLP
jgi:hypothetical protein